MKKLIALLGLALILVGCGSSNDVTEDGSGMLTSIKDNNEIVVAVSPDYAPYEFIDSRKSGQEQYVGADIDLAYYIGEKLGVEVVIAPIAFGDIPAAISNQKYDIGISGFAYTPERAEIVDFSISYDSSETSGHGFLVPADQVGNYKTLADFAGKRIAAQNGSIQYQYTSEQIENPDIRLVTSLDDAVLELNAGKVDAVAISQSVGVTIANANSNLAVSDVQFDVVDEEGMMAIVPKNQEALLNEINAIITEVKANGLYDQWVAAATALASELGVE